jgi:membrane-bound metal-dependent hydrolase YbcI (DUF457 family)
MPGYKTHMAGGAILVGGLLAGLAWLEYFRPDPLVFAALVATGTLAALFPDVDTSSRGRHFFYGIMAFVDVVLMLNGEYKWAAILGFFAMLPAIDNHRGWTHTWWAMLAVPLPILILPTIFYQVQITPLLPFYAAAVLGYLSHLALDRQF